MQPLSGTKCHASWTVDWTEELRLGVYLNTQGRPLIGSCLHTPGRVLPHICRAAEEIFSRIWQSLPGGMQMQLLQQRRQLGLQCLQRMPVALTAIWRRKVTSCRTRQVTAC